MPSQWRPSQKEGNSTSAKKRLTVKRILQGLWNSSQLRQAGASGFQHISEGLPISYTNLSPLLTGFLIWGPVDKVWAWQWRENPCRLIIYIFNSDIYFRNKHFTSIKSFIKITFRVHKNSVLGNAMDWSHSSTKSQSINSALVLSTHWFLLSLSQFFHLQHVKWCFPFHLSLKGIRKNCAIYNLYSQFLKERCSKTHCTYQSVLDHDSERIKHDIM